MSSERTAWGHGLATIHDDGAVLDTWYPQPALGARPADAQAPAELEALVGKDDVRKVRREVVTTEIDLDAAPADPADAYLRLHLLSHTLVVAQHDQPRRLVRRAGQRRLDDPGPVCRRRFRADPGRHARARPGPGPRRRQVPADDRLRRAGRRADRRRRPGPARRPPRLAAPPSCTRASSTSTPARSGTRWSRAGSARASSWATAPTSVAAPRRWAPCPAAAPSGSASASAACSAPSPAWASPSATTASSRPGLYLTAGTKVTLTDGRVVKARRAVRPVQPALHPQLRHRHRRGPRARRARHRPELGPACQRLGAAGSSSRRSSARSGTRRLVTRVVVGAARRRARRGRGGRRPRAGAATSAAPAARRPQPGTSVDFDPSQTAYAATIEAVAEKRGLPARAATIAIATAIQESKLRNLEYGDRDSRRAVPAAAEPGLGHRASRSSTRSTPPTSSTTPW